MEFKKSLRINAPAEKIYTTVSDSSKLATMVPPKLHEHMRNNASERFDMIKSIRPDQSNKRMAWDDGKGYKGSLQIENAGKESEVIVRVESAKPAVSQDEIDKILTQFLTSLQKQISPAGGQKQR